MQAILQKNMTGLDAASGQPYMGTNQNLPIYQARVFLTFWDGILVQLYLHMHDETIKKGTFSQVTKWKKNVGEVNFTFFVAWMVI